jgi:hypothetical protein
MRSRCDSTHPPGIVRRPIRPASARSAGEYSTAQPIPRFESSSNSNFVLFVSFVVAVLPRICSQRSEWRTTAVTGPPPKGYEFKSGVDGGSGGAPCSPRSFPIPTTGSGVVAHHLTTKDTKSTKESENDFELYRQWLFELKCDHVATQLIRQALFAGRFDQPRHEAPVNIRRHNRSRDSKALRIPTSCSSCPSWLLSLHVFALNGLSGERGRSTGPSDELGLTSGQPEVSVCIGWFRDLVLNTGNDQAY